MATKKTATTRTTRSTGAKKTASAVKEKATARKTTSRKQSTSLSHSVDVSPVKSTNNNTNNNSGAVIRRPYLIAIIAAVVLLVILYYLRGLFVAAVVNGQPVSRLAVIKQLEQQGGKQALQSIITNKLIEQAAEQRHVTVTQSDMNTEINTIKSNLAKQGQTLDGALASQGMSMTDLNSQIRVQKLVEKMVAPVTISDQAVTDYMNKNKDSVPAGTTPSAIKQQLAQQKLQTEEQAFVSDLQSKAKISYWVNY